MLLPKTNVYATKTSEPSGTSQSVCIGTLRNLTGYLHRNPPEPQQVSAPEPSGTLRNLARNLVLKLHRIAPELIWAKDPIATFCCWGITQAQRKWKLQTRQWQALLNGKPRTNEGQNEYQVGVSNSGHLQNVSFCGSFPWFSSPSVVLFRKRKWVGSDFNTWGTAKPGFPNQKDFVNPSTIHKHSTLITIWDVL